jgi:cation:H+ antiporter
VTGLAVLALGVLCAGVGGELFLAGLVRTARWARVSAGILASTLAAFATSSPELTVAISSVLAGAPEIALGDTLGSNVVNVALILGLAAAIAPIPPSEDRSTLDTLGALSAPPAIGLLAHDGWLSRADGLVLLAAFAAWLAAKLVEAQRQRRARDGERARDRSWPSAALALAGTALLAVGGRLAVIGAERIAAALGVHVFVIGATLVAVGTSVPELTIAVVSQLRGRPEVGLGTVLGSNIFNVGFIVAVVASIRPIPVLWQELAWPLLFGVATVALVAAPQRGRIARPRGLLLLALYAVYAFMLL